MDFFNEFFRFMLKRKKYWLIPIFISALFIALIISFSGAGAIAPFIYTLF